MTVPLTSPSPQPVTVIANEKPEPAFLSAFVQPVLVLAMTFLPLGLTNETIGLVMAVVGAGFGVYTAWRTNSTLLGAGIGLINAVVALALGFGIEIDTTTQAAIISIVTFALGAYQRTQVSPLAKGSFTTAA